MAQIQRSSELPMTIQMANCLDKLQQNAEPLHHGRLKPRERFFCCAKPFLPSVAALVPQSLPPGVHDIGVQLWSSNIDQKLCPDRLEQLATP
eukprot:5847739-Amphidinium_carterae.1